MAFGAAAGRPASDTLTCRPAGSHSGETCRAARRGRRLGRPFVTGHSLVPGLARQLVGLIHDNRVILYTVLANSIRKIGLCVG
jgi:hypothetical protein